MTLDTIHTCGANKPPSGIGTIDFNEYAHTADVFTQNLRFDQSFI